MVAGYTDNVIDQLGYISIVATLPDYQRQGLARKLVLEFIKECESKNLRGVHLYTAYSNTGAIKMYLNIGFVEYKCINEARPNDLHLIYHI